MTKLFTPYKIRSVELKNRLVISPMCQYSAEDGMANDWHLVHLGSRATGGAGLVFTEAVSVSPEGRISPQDLGLWKKEQVAPFKRITDFIHANGAVAGIQIAHAGHKAGTYMPWEGRAYIPQNKGGWQPVAASEHELAVNQLKSKELSITGIQEIKDQFINSTKLAKEAGFRVFEIHAAHGYLLNGFLSPLINKRTDSYGGSFENRTRLLLEIVKEVRAVIGDDAALFVRLSAIDWSEEGWKIEDSVMLSKLLKEAGVDVIDCSSGGLVPPSAIKVEPGYQVPFAEQIKKEAGVATAAVGLITDAHQANQIVEEEKADLIFIGRESLRDPNFPLRAAHDLGVAIEWPVQYERGKWR
ncbi:NADH:flavin oxidoreductase/NADH oxidase [Jiulongibacter sp. NS-SX5]|uniref:NADH:flavin oxidoreductase/NADH oxidase n=1 Tax=Jiulongibacter sp. NS-SX5 TaxID=3463854 RepID=UPI0040582B72